jgi:hypothetical protein
MHQLQSFQCVILHRGREHGALLVPSETTVADLINVVDLWQSTHHVILRQAIEAAKIKMDIPHVLVPCQTRALHRETHWHVHVNMEGIKGICSAPDLGSQDPGTIPQLEETSV